MSLGRPLHLALDDFGAQFQRGNAGSREAREMLTNLLEIDGPVISAIYGPTLIHSELPVLADVVIASHTVAFRDTHMAMGGNTARRTGHGIQRVDS